MPQEIRNYKHVLHEKKSDIKLDYIEKLTDILGTSKFIFALTLFFGLWIGLNTFNSKPFDPYPFLLISTAINMGAAYTTSFLIKADKAERKRDEIKHDHEFEVNKAIVDGQKEILQELRISHKNLRSLVINTSNVPGAPEKNKNHNV